RDPLVTGVQTCALPIWGKGRKCVGSLSREARTPMLKKRRNRRRRRNSDPAFLACSLGAVVGFARVRKRTERAREALCAGNSDRRSEERRVGKEWRWMWS